MKSTFGARSPWPTTQGWIGMARGAALCCEFVVNCTGGAIRQFAARIAVLVALLYSGAALAQVLEGIWIGTTDQGTQISFTVTGNAFTSGQVEFRDCHGMMGTFTQTVDYFIQPPTVDVGSPLTLSDELAPGLSWSLNLTFVSSTSASGTFGITISSCALQTINLTASAAGTATCTYSLSPTSQSVAANATTGLLSVRSTSGCTWTASSNANWITITRSNDRGNGTVAYAVAANSSSSSRTGILTIAGRTFTVTQAPGIPVPICNLTASASTINLGGSVTLTATCSPAATSYAWTPATGLIARPANTAIVTPTAAGVYQYSVTGSNAAGAGNLASASVTVVAVSFTSQSNCFFSWVEITYPDWFAPAGAISNTLAPYYYRYYARTNAYLATSSANSHVYYLGPLSSNSILDLGALSGWLTAVGCQ